jgi:Histidine kinase-, DNA gyrase B-, and HSP90-like ATPase
MTVRVAGIVLCLTVLLLPFHLTAAEMRARSILVLDQSEAREPFYYQVFSGLRSAVNADSRSHTTLYAENLDLSRFNGAGCEDSLRRQLKEKYRDRPIGVVVAVGTATLELVLRWRAELWPGVPVVFALVDETDFARLKLPPDVTGGIVRLALADSIKAARAVVPDLDSVVFVGARWDRQAVFRNWKDEIPAAAAGLNVIEIIGATMAETRKRVEALPERSAILYSSMYSDGEGAFYPPATREVFELLSMQASTRKIELSLQASPGALHVKGDPVQLQQVILNLIVNSMDAVGATPDGRTVIGRTEMNGESSAIISISDSGPGIPPDQLNEVFDPFFTTKKQGMGIGLSIARTIVQAHRGRIWAENQAGGGAVFRLSLPLSLT